MRTQDNVSEKRRAEKMSVITLALSLLAFIALVVFIALFINSNKQLRMSIQQERIDYVEEISHQITSSQMFMEKEFSETVMNYAGILNNIEITTMDEVRLCFEGKNPSEILLMREDGEIIDLSGNSIFLSDRTLIRSLSGDEEVVQLFTSLSSEADYWLFAARLNDIEFDGDTYETLILAIPAIEFRDSLAISLFDNRGASFIIKPNGTIEIKPGGANMVFSGYNLFTSMLRAGASEEDVRALEGEIAVSATGNRLIKIHDEEWLISYTSLDDLNNIVVTVPLTITAAQTYSGLLGTILFAVLAVLSMGIISVLLVSHFFRRDREHRREAMVVAAKSDFFSKMNHDIRTPLNAVIGLEMLAKDNLDKPEIASDYLTKSSSAADYLLSILNDVLDMSSIESGKVSIVKMPFDMNELIMDIDDIIRPMAQEKELCFEVDSANFGTAYIGDHLRLKQILMNLLSNAVKFTKNGGSVRFSIARESGTKLDWFTFSVSDTGIGMSEKYLKHIFTPFEQERSSYTEQYTGSGLGLAIAHSLVTMMNGNIDVESKEGAGTTFTVTLPFERGERIEADMKKADSPALSLAGMRVLMAEDNALNQEITAALLTSRFDLEVEAASNGKQALDMFAASEPGYYDIILMDVKMPVMDGHEATRRIRQLNRPDAKTIPIVALSANAFDVDVRMSIEAGMNEHLSKPINIKALTNVFTKYLRN